MAVLQRLPLGRFCTRACGLTATTSAGDCGIDDRQR